MDNNQKMHDIPPLEIRSESGHRIEVSPGPPNSKLPGFNRMGASGGFGNMDFFHFAGNGFDIWYSNYAMTRDAKFVSRGNLPVLELQIPFNSHFVSRWDGKEEMLLEDKQFEMSY